MPVEEKAVCTRLRRFRDWMELSQAEFSVLAGLGQRTYASYEYQRSQLNYPAAVSILQAAHWLNPNWLAEGLEPMVGGRRYQYPDPASLGIGPRTSFRDAYLRFLKVALLACPRGAYLPPWPRLQIFGGEPTVEGRLRDADKFHSLLARWLSWLPDSHVRHFWDELFRRSAQIAARYPRDSDERANAKRLAEIMEFLVRRHQLEALQIFSSLPLTSPSLKSRTPGVDIRTLGELRAVLRAKITQKGDMARMARALIVPQARVSEWLSGKKEPGGKMTLRLLEWIKEPERKQEPPATRQRRQGRRSKSQVKL